jgi:aryl-alcohol dehydrogenase-like predicted oxidoreductase
MNATPAQVAWLLAQKPWILLIPGTRNENHLTENTDDPVAETNADKFWKQNDAACCEWP